jgi:hypothetical protein
MKTYRIYINPGDRREEFRATSEQHATQQAVARFPGHTFGKPRDTTPKGYARDFVDSLAGMLPDRMPA